MFFTVLTLLVILLGVYSKGVNAANVECDVKPSFLTNATVLWNSVMINITNGVNIDHAAIFDSGGNWVGNMTRSGSDWTYVINGLYAGTYNYKVLASSIPAVEGQSSPEPYVTAEPVSANVTSNVKVDTIEYGRSGEGRQLNYIEIAPPVITSKILAVFCIHGFEDNYNQDGQNLANIGNQMITYFTNNPEKLGTTALYVVPCANPDGLINGWTNNGPGRCQILGGVDINRDFNYCWHRRTNSRNKTLAPFSALESRALRDLVINVGPDDVIDIHGWMNTTYGTHSLDQYFENSIGIGYSGGLSGASGYFSAWAMAYAKRTALIELPGPNTDPQRVINAFVNLCASRATTK